MKLREFRRTDAPRFFALLKSEFAEEEAVTDTRREGYDAIIGRLFRWDVRTVLAVLRLFRRSPFHFYVIEDGGKVAALTQLSFTPRAGFLSAVVVAPEFRHRGYARSLLETARIATARRGRPYLALRVLESNGPARALYTSAGYTELDRAAILVQDPPRAGPAAATAGAVRPYTREDARRLAEIANRRRSERMREVLPVRPKEIGGRSVVDRLFDAETGAWVVDRGAGAEAFVSASSSPATAAAHLGTPILSEEVGPELVGALLDTAGRWLVARHPARVETSVSESDPRARAALAEVGYHEAIRELVLYRPSQ